MERKKKKGEISLGEFSYDKEEGEKNKTKNGKGTCFLMLPIGYE
jgi:hypothetical protein